ncbi:MAG: Holliday junction resolvase Hjc [Nanoarchaeota archaeon]
MSNKSKGSNAERELYQMFVDNNYRAVRVAGSGVMENADCDIIAGKKGKKYCIEAKSCKKLPKYITKDQINRFMIFSDIFGLKPAIAVRINRTGWIFLNPLEMEDSGKNWVINEEILRKKGKKFSQFFGEKIKQEKADSEKEKSLKITEHINLDEKELDNLIGDDYSGD